MMDPDEVCRKIREAMPDAQVEITDLTGTKDHYQVRVVSEAFQGQNPLQRHRAVYRALGEAVGAEVHALSVEARTPSEVS